MTTEKLKNLLKIFTGEALREEILAENANTLAEYYREQGFPFVKVTYHTTEEGEAPVIIFTIAEGAQVRVQQITITGNHAFATKQLRKHMFTDTGGLFSKGLYQEKVFQEDLLAIKAFYQQNGYLEVDVMSVTKEFSEDQRQVSVALVIREGIQTRITEIRLLGESDETTLKKIRKRLLLKNGDPLNISKTTQSVDRIKEFYANQGYIKAEVDVSTEFSADNSQVTVTFTIAPGKKFYIGKISIQGVFRTKEVFITRELRVKEEDVYNPQKIRETVRGLNQSGLYDNVTFRRLDPKSDAPIQDMSLAVSETLTKDVEFGVGYSTENGPRGFVEYTDKNVFNFGGKGSARAELSIDQQKYQPKIILQYLQPHFLIQDLDLVAAVFDDIQKDNESFDVERRGGRLGVRRNFTRTLSASLGYYFEQDDPSNVNEAAQLSDLDTEILNIGGIDAYLTWDLLDDAIQPKQGGFSRLYLRMANNALGSETNFFELNAQTNWYLKLFQDYVLACSLNGKLIEPTQSSTAIPIYNRYFLGGDTTVRGFSKDSIGPTAIDGTNIGGDRLVRFNVEFRFPIYSVLGGVIFYDAGANWLDAEGFTSEDIRTAIGAGLRVNTPVGPLRFDYGWKLDRRSGESAGEYYLTVGSVF